jgi:YVTN family beta-propeller protein
MGARAEQTLLLVLLKGTDTLAYYSPDGKLVDKVELGDEPSEMVVTPDGKFVYVIDNVTAQTEKDGKGDNSLSMVDLVRKRVTKVGLSAFRRPASLAVEPRTGQIATVVRLPVETLLLIDPDSRRIQRRYPTEGKGGHAVAFESNTKGAEYAYVSNAMDAMVSAIQINTGFVRKLPTGPGPDGSVLSKDGTLLFVCNKAGASVTVIDTTRRATLSEIKTGKGPVEALLAPDGRTLIVALHDDKKLEYIDLETRRVNASTPLPGAPNAMALSPDGKEVFLSLREMDTVAVVTLADKKLARQFTTDKGSLPGTIAFVRLP